MVLGLLVSNTIPQNCTLILCRCLFCLKTSNNILVVLQRCFLCHLSDLVLLLCTKVRQKLSKRKCTSYGNSSHHIKYWNTGLCLPLQETVSMEPDSACHLRKYIADMCYLFNKYDLAYTWMGFSELFFYSSKI